MELLLKDQINITALQRQVELRFPGHDPRISLGLRDNGVGIEVFLPDAQVSVWKLFEPDGSDEGFGHQVFMGTYEIMDDLDKLLVGRVA